MSIAMKNRARTAAGSQGGYAMLMVIFLTTVLLLGAIAAAPYIRTERQREKEQEMIWRGNGAQKQQDRKSTRLNSSHTVISYAVFCLKKKKTSRVYPECSRHWSQQMSRNRADSVLRQPADVTDPELTLA